MSVECLHPSAQPIVINREDVPKHDFAQVEVATLFSKPEISVAVVELDGQNELGCNTTSDMYYYVIEGEGKFVIDGKEYPVFAGSLVVIPKGYSYYDVGQLTMLSIATPSFNPEDVVPGSS